MKKNNLLAITGFGTAILGGYLWMVNQVPLSLILWGVTFIIIIRLNRMKKSKNKDYAQKKR
jgi:hypothetical protein